MKLVNKRGKMKFVFFWFEYSFFQLLSVPDEVSICFTTFIYPWKILVCSGVHPKEKFSSAKL